MLLLTPLLQLTVYSATLLCHYRHLSFFRKVCKYFFIHDKLTDETLWWKGSPFSFYAIEPDHSIQHMNRWLTVYGGLSGPPFLPGTFFLKNYTSWLDCQRINLITMSHHQESLYNSDELLTKTVMHGDAVQDIWLDWKDLFVAFVQDFKVVK